jgi:predicted MFS family arabinose efflux permease
MLYLAIVLLVVAETDSYALAGAISMVSSVVLSIATPLWSRVADQYGQNRVLSITVPIHVAALGAFVYLVKSDAPTWSWFVAAIVFESFVIGSGQMVRRRWIHAIGDDRKLIDTAYSFEAFVDEVIFTTGPVITTLVATFFFPAASIFTAMGFIIIGALLFASLKDTQPPPQPKVPGEDHSLLIRDRFIQALFIPLMLCGSCFSATGLVIVGYLDEFGNRNNSGFYVAIWSLSSGISAFLSGAIHWKLREAQRFINATLALFVLTIPIFVSAYLAPGNLRLFAAALFFNGLAIAPLLTAGLALAERSVSPRRTTEVLAWAISALNLGSALPTAITGYIIDTYGASVAMSIPVVCMALSILSFLPFIRLWREKVR